MHRFFSITLILLLAACANPTLSQTRNPEPTLTSTPKPTPLPTPTETPPPKPANVHDLTVYNYETKKDEIISPTFDKDMNTWVWKNSIGEVRRFIDIETGHIFAQTASVGQYNQPENQRIIYQVDTGFGWETDLANIDKIPKGHTATGQQYLGDIWNLYPNTVGAGNSETKLIFKIVRGGYDDIADKSRISFSLENSDISLREIFLFPAYNPKNNTYVLTGFYSMPPSLVGQFTIPSLTDDLLNRCPTSNPPKIYPIGVVDVKIPKKAIH